MKKERNSYIKKSAAILLAVTLAVPSSISVFAAAAPVAKETKATAADDAKDTVVKITNKSGATAKDVFEFSSLPTGVIAAKIGTATDTDNITGGKIELPANTLGATKDKVNVTLLKTSGSALVPVGAPIPCDYNAEVVSTAPVATTGITAVSTIGKPFTVTVKTTVPNTIVNISVEGKDYAFTAATAGANTYTLNADGPLSTTTGGLKDLKVTFTEPDCAPSAEVIKKVTGYATTSIADYDGKFTAANNTGNASDTVTLVGAGGKVGAGDTFKVYDPSGNLIATSPAGVANRDLVCALDLPESGDVYVTVSKKGMLESAPMFVSINGLATSMPIHLSATAGVGAKVEIKVKAADVLTINGLENETGGKEKIPAGTIFQVYEDGNLLVTSTKLAASTDSTTVTIPAGKLSIYGGTITVVTNVPGQNPSLPIEVDYDAEGKGTNNIDANNVKFTYFASPLASEIVVKGTTTQVLAAGDVVNVYDSVIATTPIVKATVAKDKDTVTLKPKLLSGQIYVSVTKVGYSEGTRFEVLSSGVSATIPVALRDISSVNNVVIDDVLTIKNTVSGTVYKVYARSGAGTTASPYVYDVEVGSAIANSTTTNISLEDTVAFLEPVSDGKKLVQPPVAVTAQAEWQDESPQVLHTPRAELASVKPKTASITALKGVDTTYPGVVISGVAATDVTRIVTNVPTSIPDLLAAEIKEKSRVLFDTTFTTDTKVKAYVIKGNGTVEFDSGVKFATATIQNATKKPVPFADLSRIADASTATKTSLSADNITYVNNTGDADTITIKAAAKLPAGTEVHVYAARPGATAAIELVRGYELTPSGGALTTRANADLVIKTSLPVLRLYDANRTPVASPKIFVTAEAPGFKISDTIAKEYKQTKDLPSNVELVSAVMGANGKEDVVTVKVESLAEIKVYATDGGSSYGALLGSKIVKAPKFANVASGTLATYEIKYPNGTFKKAKLNVGDKIYVEAMTPGMNWGYTDPIDITGANQTSSATVSATTFVITNGSGTTADKIEFKGLAKTFVGATARVYDETGSLRFTGTLATSNDAAIMKATVVKFLKAAGGKLSVTLQMPNQSQSNKVDVTYGAEPGVATDKSEVLTLATADVTVDPTAKTVTFKEGKFKDKDIVRLYRTELGTSTLAAPKVATAGSLVVKVNDNMLASSGSKGEFYVARVSEGKIETDRVRVEYGTGDFVQTAVMVDPIVSVTNNVGTGDFITVKTTGYERDSVIYVVAAATTTAAALTDKAKAGTITLTDSMIKAGKVNVPYAGLPTALTADKSALDGVKPFAAIKAPNKTVSAFATTDAQATILAENAVPNNLFAVTATAKTVGSNGTITLRQSVVTATSGKMYRVAARFTSSSAISTTSSQAIEIGYVYSNPNATSGAALVIPITKTNAIDPEHPYAVDIVVAEVNATTKALKSEYTTNVSGVAYGYTAFPSGFSATAVNYKDDGFDKITITVPARTQGGMVTIYDGPTSAARIMDSMWYDPKATSIVVDKLMMPAAGGTWYASFLEGPYVESLRETLATPRATISATQIIIPVATDKDHPTTTVPAKTVVKPVTQMAFTPDGKYLFIPNMDAGFDYTIYKGTKTAATKTATIATAKADASGYVIFKSGVDMQKNTAIWITAEFKDTTNGANGPAATAVSEPVKIYQFQP